jgi:hypothetical protein
MKYKTDFTIRPANGKYLLPLDVAGKIADGEECCVIAHEQHVCAIHEGGYFRMSGSRYPLEGVTEATPIPAEDQWPKGCDWATDDWEDRGIYPPKPVQPAVLIVTLPDGRELEVESPFTDETPPNEAWQAQNWYNFSLNRFAINASYLYGVKPSAVRWAWQEK